MKKNAIKTIWPLLALIICTFVLLFERSGVKYETSVVNQNQENTSGVKEMSFTKDVIAEAKCLLIIDSTNKVSVTYQDIMTYVLDSMRITYDTLDLSKDEFTDLSKYETIVLACSDLSSLKENILVLFEWVKAGGRMMNTNTYETSNYFMVIEKKIGINECDNEYVEVSGFRVLNDFMIGGDKEFKYETSSKIAIGVGLSNQCKVYMESIGNNIPLLWECDYGKGKTVTINQTITGKVSRGILASAYSLLEDVCVYPIINASAFYIDDFPSPVPEGDSTFIREEYHVSVSDFYTNIWWPELLKWEKKYGIVHTGVIIEDYSDIEKAPFKEQSETQRFKFFGNMLLNNGGELGWHGYNHMPLCLKGFDYKGLYDDYDLWKNDENIIGSITELQRFTKELFPKQKFAVYVPPSNILSEEARRILKEKFPNIQVIASTYLTGECEYTQEFEVSADGMIETPRITSGCNITDYMKLVAFSELNFQYVQSHFLHPDDALDVDRGADLGWAKLAKLFENYLNWIYASAPDIRNVTGSQMGTAVKQYDKLTVSKTVEGNKMIIQLGGFSGEAYLMIRTNQETIQSVEGGEMTHVTGNLYILEAKQDTVILRWEE